MEKQAEETFVEGTIRPNCVMEPLLGFPSTDLIGTVLGRPIAATVECAGRVATAALQWVLLQTNAGVGSAWYSEGLLQGWGVGHENVTAAVRRSYASCRWFRV